MSFNFNKLRAMVAARVLVGIQLDTDQLITPGLDRMFASTRREIHERYPWLMLPVHWMSRDALWQVFFSVAIARRSQGSSTT